MPSITASTSGNGGLSIRYDRMAIPGSTHLQSIDVLDLCPNAKRNEGHVVVIDYGEIWQQASVRQFLVLMYSLGPRDYTKILTEYPKDKIEETLTQFSWRCMKPLGCEAAEMARAIMKYDPWSTH